MARNAEIPAPAAAKAPAPAPPQPHSEINTADLQPAVSTSTSSSPTLSDVSSLSSPDPSLSLSHNFPAEQRNQAPGIPDRRKSVRPSSRSQSRHRSRDIRKSKASPLSISMANMGNAMKLRDDDEDETPGEKSVCYTIPMSGVCNPVPD